MEDSKLINSVSSTSPEHVFEVKQNYTFEEMKTIAMEAIINKLALAY
jgi:hypothetical protein